LRQFFCRIHACILFPSSAYVADYHEMEIQTKGDMPGNCRYYVAIKLGCCNAVDSWGCLF
jgi:hypothetical protein